MSYDENGEYVDFKEPDEGRDYKDITSLSAEQVEEWQTEDPKEFYGNLARQTRDEVGREEYLARFAQSHPDFDGLWHSEALQRIMRENPEVNDVVSAYYHFQKGDKRMDTIKDQGGKAALMAKRSAERQGKRPGLKSDQSFGGTIPTMPDDV